VGGHQNAQDVVVVQGLNLRKRRFFSVSFHASRIFAENGREITERLIIKIFALVRAGQKRGRIDFDPPSC
jgi:hypothetical protein